MALDVLGELPETENGNKYILVVSDYYTKWTHAMAMPDQTAQTIADVFLREFVAILGVPTMLHSDQGRSFEGHIFQEVCALLGIEKSRTTPYHPASDGQVERFNRTIQQMLKSYVNENRDDWDEQLPYLCMAYRATPHESTGCSPNLMTFGSENNMPIDVIAGVPPDSRTELRYPTQYVQWLQQTLNHVYQFADKHLEKSAKRQKNYYDLKSKPVKFKAGDYVWRWYPPISRGKLSKGWVGPCRVIESPTEVNCIIKLNPDDQKTTRVHINSLKPFYGKLPALWLVFEESLAVDSNRDNETGSEMEEVDSLDATTSSESDSEEDGLPQDLGRGRRMRKPPARFSP